MEECQGISGLSEVISKLLAVRGLVELVGRLLSFGGS